ncbi:MAG: hypothetical protein M1823_004352 [Watsoniomyces obsoletus]|nr:MAG: hypothetical protein M1823_004352 [Watsoniomyces obsoletus]
MRSLYLPLIAVWALATSISTTPTTDKRLTPAEIEFGVFGPPRGTVWSGLRIDAHYMSGSYTPQQILDIWGTYEQEKELIIKEAWKEYPNPEHDDLRSRYIEKKLGATLGPKDQVYYKLKNLQTRKAEDVPMNSKNAWTTIDREAVRWKARRALLVKEKTELWKKRLEDRRDKGKREKGNEGKGQ